MVLLLSTIVQALCGGCWKLIQILLIKIREGLSRHCIQRFVGNIQRLVQAEMRLVYFLLHISDFISVRLYERVTCGIWTLSRLW